MSFGQEPTVPRYPSRSLEVPNEDVVFVRVRTVLMEALGAEKHEVHSDAVLDQLGAESIDYLDIRHRLNGLCDVKLPDEPLPLTVRGLVALVRRTAEAKLQ